MQVFCVCTGGGSGEEEEQDWPCQEEDAVQQTVCQHSGHIWQEAWTEQQLMNKRQLPAYGESIPSTHVEVVGYVSC